MHTAFVALETSANCWNSSRTPSLSLYTLFAERKTAPRQYWHNHFSTIGLVGMNEAVRLFRPDIEHQKVTFATHVLTVCVKGWRIWDQSGNMYNLSNTGGRRRYRLARLMPNATRGSRIVKTQAGCRYTAIRRNCRLIIPTISGRHWNCRMSSE